METKSKKAESQMEYCGSCHACGGDKECPEEYGVDLDEAGILPHCSAACMLITCLAHEIDDPIDFALERLVLERRVYSHLEIIRAVLKLLQDKGIRDVCDDEIHGLIKKLGGLPE